MKTQFLNQKNIERKWLLVDATGHSLGRLASRVAILLRGKHKPEWSPDVDAGDYVVVINADKVVLTGNKAESKAYFKQNPRPGSSGFTSHADMVLKHPDFPIVHAVKGMLPKNILGNQVIKKLHVYVGTEHPHVAQQPQQVTI